MALEPDMLSREGSRSPCCHVAVRRFLTAPSMAFLADYNVIATSCTLSAIWKVHELSIARETN